MDSNRRIQKEVYKMKITFQIQAVLLDEFHIQNTNQQESTREVDQNMILQVIQDEDIRTIITTSSQIQREFIQIPIIFVQVNQDGQVNSDIIIRDNGSITITQGNILYLFDTYITMIKYIICLQLIRNFTQDLHNLDPLTQDIIKSNKELKDYIELIKFGLGSSNSTQDPNSQILVNQQTYQLPPPIRIPVFQFNQFQLNE
ncbi:unnamed protein product [Paramecium octaurelia]|uniref:Uncharacterized protein n=1 Tax=Paramecium octaurelia TaxID=43137 RepID=A0A8S1VP52_PAROT|nr:unnamed protein product [Paramecium octaurelia]